MNSNETYLEILEITKPHGLKGEMRAKYYCDDPNEPMDYERLYLGVQKSPVSLTSCRLSKNMLVIGIDGVNTIDGAQRLAGQFLYIDRNDVSLDENVWFIRDLIGLNVHNADSGERYGIVEEILQNAPADVYVIRTDDGKQLLFPSIPEVLIDVKLTEKKILIRPLEGLFDL